MSSEDGSRADGNNYAKGEELDAGELFLLILAAFIDIA